MEPLNISLNIEDNRLPSDESLQNYTNGLDFSTSLFDTDRMPSFDISGSSRSETEFNPYGISYRYDHELTSGTGFEKLSNDLNKSQSSYSEVCYFFYKLEFTHSAVFERAISQLDDKSIVLISKL